MTRKQFHRRLLSLIQEAHKAELCAACVTLELAAAAAAVAEIAQLTPEQFEQHFGDDEFVTAISSSDPVH